jgi:predicted DNA-binding transcriptional regulator YafY
VALEGHSNKLEHPSDEVLSSAVAALRQGDAAAPSARPKNAVRLTTAETVGVLREAVANKAKVWIGYANEAGREVEHVVQPIRLNAGKLTAFDQRSAKVGDFSIARITMIAIMSE